MPELNITGQMPPEPNPTRLNVAPSAHTPNSNLDSPIVRHSSTSINSSTTDLDKAENRPLDERDDFPFAANEIFPSRNPATTAPGALEAQLPVQHNETAVGASAPMNPATTAPEAFEAQPSVQHDEISVGASANLQSDESNHNDTVPCQDTSVSSMVPVKISFPETSKSPQQKASPVVALKANGSKAKTPKKTPLKTLKQKMKKTLWIRYGYTVNEVSNLIKTRS